MKFSKFALFEYLQNLRDEGPLFFYRRICRNSSSLIHVGAHLAEEKSLYQELGFLDIFWIEANPSVYLELSKKVGQENCVRALVWSEKGINFSFNISNNSVSSSIYNLSVDKPWSHVEMIDCIDLVSTTLDDLVMTNSRLSSLAQGSLIILDIQGAELPALKGALHLLARTSGLIVEVSKKTTYSGGTDFKSLDRFLKSAGFVRAGEWLDFKNGHGDALYLSKKLKVGLGTKILGRATWLANFTEFALRVLSRRGLIRQ